MIKLFVSDLDGTLLNVDHKVSPEVKEAVHALRKNGISFMPASGRDYYMLMDVMQQLEIKPKCICLNGAEFYDNDGKLIKEYPLDEDALQKIVEVIDELNLDVDFYTEDGRYNYGEEKYLYDMLLARFYNLFHENDKQKLIEFIEENKLLIDTTCEPDINKILSHKVMKVEIYLSNQIQKNLAFKKLKKIDHIVAVGSHDTNLEVTSDKATKGGMVEKVCEYYGYDKDEVVVIGDGFNDASMFQKFTNSFCMGQASDDLKKFANYVAPNNEDNGVAQVIYEILKNGKEIPVEE